METMGIENSELLGKNDDTSEESAMEDDGSVEFTKTMRIATRKAHKMSDALVNAKLSIAMSNDKIWAEGLLIFYEVFRFLEEAVVKLSPRLEAFNKMGKVVHGIERTTAFEEDLEFYYGKNWLSGYNIRPSVANYLRHLKILEEREPLRLLAYIYHLYMGLLSGGQILQKKRDLKNKLKSVGGLLGNSSDSNTTGRGDAVTRLRVDGRSISDIKKDFTFTLNDIASDLSKDEKASLISESILVFQYNNEIIRSIENTGRVATVAILTNPVVIFLTVVLILMCCYMLYSFN